MNALVGDRDKFAQQLAASREECAQATRQLQQLRSSAEQSEAQLKRQISEMLAQPD